MHNGEYDHRYKSYHIMPMSTIHSEPAAETSGFPSPHVVLVADWNTTSHLPTALTYVSWCGIVGKHEGEGDLDHLEVKEGDNKTEEIQSRRQGFVSEVMKNKSSHF